MATHKELLAEGKRWLEEERLRFNAVGMHDAQRMIEAIQEELYRTESLED